MLFKSNFGLKKHLINVFFLFYDDYDYENHLIFYFILMYFSVKSYFEKHYIHYSPKYTYIKIELFKKDEWN
jgi:hypothetical protein